MGAMDKFGQKDPSKSELLVRRLYQIASEYQQGFERQLKQLLELGCELLDLEIGIVSRIDGDTYQIVSAVCPKGVDLSPGDVFELGTTYCSRTVSAVEPIGFEHAGETDMASHPAYHTFQLESYIGVALRVSGSLYGTFNFSSSDARARKFRDIEVDCLKLMASWLESELARRHVEEELRNVNKALERSQKRLRFLAAHDPLTGVLNRREAFRRLGEERARAERVEGSVGIILLDLDHFKKINDVFGHLAGDELLVEATDRLKGILRTYDVIGRYGGEEFMIILPGANLEQAGEVAERFRKAISGKEFRLDTEMLKVTASLGVTSTTDANRPEEELLAEADQALYRAKWNGRDRVEVKETPQD